MGRPDQIQIYISDAREAAREAADPNKTVAARERLVLGLLENIGSGNRVAFNKAGGYKIIEEMVAPLLVGFNSDQLITIMGFLRPKSDAFESILTLFWSDGSRKDAFLFRRAARAYAREKDSSRYDTIVGFWLQKTGSNLL